MTRAEKHFMEIGGSRFRRARKIHRCDSYFGRCAGDGSIMPGERYLDTADMKEFTKGPVPYRVCHKCADIEV